MPSCLEQFLQDTDTVFRTGRTVSAVGGQQKLDDHFSVMLKPWGIRIDYHLIPWGLRRRMQRSFPGYLPPHTSGMHRMWKVRNDSRM